jgi:hypothetical protein
MKSRIASFAMMVSAIASAAFFAGAARPAAAYELPTLSEMTAPSAPSAGSVVQYAQDAGANTEYVIGFASENNFVISSTGAVTVKTTINALTGYQLNGATVIDSSGLTLSAKNLITDTTTGMKIGTATNQKIGFFNATPVVQPTALTTQLTTVTFTAPGTPDYAWGAGTNTNAYGWTTNDEFKTAASVIANLQTRVSELETKIKALGLIA